MNGKCGKGYPRACISRRATHQSTAQQDPRREAAFASTVLQIATATPKDFFAAGIASVLAHAGARTRHCRQPRALRATPRRNRHSIDLTKHDESASRGFARRGPAPCCRGRRSSRSGLAARPQAVSGVVQTPSRWSWPRGNGRVWRSAPSRHPVAGRVCAASSSGARSCPPVPPAEMPPFPRPACTETGRPALAAWPTLPAGTIREWAQRSQGRRVRHWQRG